MDEVSLASILRAALENGEHALTFVQLAARFNKIRESQVREGDIAGMRHYLPDARLLLTMQDEPLATILVTADYFEVYHANNRLPHNFDAAKACCALHRRKAAGIRIATLGRRKDDPIFLTWIALNGRTAQGIQGANLERLAIEFQKGKVSLPNARQSVDKALSIKRSKRVDALLKATNGRRRH